MPELAPAVEGVQQAHRLGLVFARAGLDDGGDHDLDESAAERVEENRRQNREIRVRHAGGEQAQRQQSGKGGQVGGDNARLVSDAVHELAGQHVHDQLGDEVDGDEGGKPRHVDAECRRERDEQQRHEVIDYRLSDVSHEAGGDSVVVVRGCGAHRVSIAEKAPAKCACEENRVGRQMNNGKNRVPPHKKESGLPPLAQGVSTCRPGGPRDPA